jgi:ABC-type bacteriocin/lantibiotic exporter with double-glycine peptidase domain
MVMLAQIRDAIFAKVGQRAVRELSIRTFRHLHALSLKFHLERRTGGLSRIISRGTAGVDTVLRFSLFNTFPTALEIAWSLAPCLVLRLDLRRSHLGHRGFLSLVHLCSHRMAHQYPAQYE